MLHRYLTLLIAVALLFLIISCEKQMEPSSSANGSWQIMESGTNVHLNSVWGTSSSNVYAVGDDGVVLHYDGNTWSPMDINKSEPVYDIWGSSQNDIYIVGNNQLFMHYDGTEWTDVPGNINGVRINGCNENDVVVMGGYIQHFNGTAWDSIAYGAENDVWCNCDPIHPSIPHEKGDLIVLSSYYAIRVIEDENMQSILARDMYIINEVWGKSLNSLHLCANNGRIGYYDGESIKLVHRLFDYSINFNSISGFSYTSIFTVGSKGYSMYYDGLSWVFVATGVSADLNKVWCTPDNVAFAVGDRGTILKSQ